MLLWMLFLLIMHFCNTSQARSLFLHFSKFPFCACAEPTREARLHFKPHISWNLMCAERKPHITFLYFRCSRLGLLQFQGIGTPTHCGAHFFFLLPCACQYTFLFFSTPPKREALFSSPRQRKCDRRSHFSPRASNLASSNSHHPISMRITVDF